MKSVVALKSSSVNLMAV